MSEISLKLDVLPLVEVLRPFIKQRIHHLFGLLFLHNGWVKSHLLHLGIFFLWASCLTGAVMEAFFFFFVVISRRDGNFLVFWLLQSFFPLFQDIP